MINSHLVEYVKSQMASGNNQEKIRADLVQSGGWDHKDIDDAFAAIGSGQVAAPVQGVPTAPVKYAGFWIRAVAMILDGLILMIPIALVQLALFFAFKLERNLAYNIISSASGMLITWTYAIAMINSSGSTLGKKAVGIRVLSADDSQLSLGRIIVRETIGRLLSALLLCVGYLMVIFTGRKQSLHDKLARTVVVYKNPGAPMSGWTIFAIIMAAVLPAIAVLGILSSVVLASLSSARQKGMDATIRHELTSLRVQSEIYAVDNDDTYLPAKDCFSGMFLEIGHANIITNSKSKDLSCKAYAESYAVSAQLSDPESYFCIDSTGFGAEGQIVDTGSGAYCQIAENAKADSVEQAVTMSTASYSLDFPNGWQIVETDEKSSAAVHPGIKSTVAINRLDLTEQYGQVSSISDIINADIMKQGIKAQYPKVVVQGVVQGSLDGSEALISTYNSGELKDEKGESYYLATVQYSAVRNGAIYTVVMMSSVGSVADSLVFDGSAIMNSFKFLK